VDARFGEAVAKAREEGWAGHLEIGDYLIWSEHWGQSCLTYPEVAELHLGSDAEKLGASVHRLVSKEEARGLTLHRVEWVRDTEFTRQKKLLGISVFLFYKTDKFRGG
jgi:hypothetical protein